MISAGEWVRLAALYDFDAWTFLLGVGTDKIRAFMQPNIVPSNPANVRSLAAARCSSAIRSKGSWHLLTVRRRLHVRFAGREGSIFAPGAREYLGTIGHGGRRGHPQPKLITVCEALADQVCR